MNQHIQFKRLSETARIPVRGSEWAAGFDLSAAADCVVPARGKALVKTDLSIAIPENTYARIAPRSGLAWKHSIDVGAGVIDYDYRGAVGVVLFNYSDVDFAISTGDRVAQMVLECISMVEAVEVQELSATARGAGGFGSTGVSNGVHGASSGSVAAGTGAIESLEPSAKCDVMQVKRLSETARIPVRGSEWAAGFDLSAAADCVVPARGKALVKTDLSIAIPENTYARIAPRSGLAWKHSIDVGAGVIDYDYRGAVGVVLFNHSDVDFAISTGDRVAQMVLECISMVEAVEVQELSATTRGAGGFGSTGVSNGVHGASGGSVAAGTGAIESLEPSAKCDVMQVKRLSETARIPVRGSEWAAGFDLSAAADCVVPARGKALVKTDLSIAIPENTYARIAPRSGLAWKHSIDVGAGVIDYDYRGAVGVVLFNHSDVDFAISTGDRVAQMVLECISMVEAEEVQELSATARGAGGFGSTGVSNGVHGASGGSVAAGTGAVESSPSKKVRIEEDQASQLATVLLFLEVTKEIMGQKRKSLLKMAVLTDDVLLSQLYRIFVAYQAANNAGEEASFDLLTSVDELLLDSNNLLPAAPQSS